MVKCFGTALNCIDARTKEAILQWMRSQFCMDNLDLIAEPDINIILAGGNPVNCLGIKNMVAGSINSHNSAVLAVVGHSKCAGTPHGDGVDISDIAKSVNTVKSWEMPLMVVGLWVDELWNVQMVCM